MRVCGIAAALLLAIILICGGVFGAYSIKEKSAAIGREEKSADTENSAGGDIADADGVTSCQENSGKQALAAPGDDDGQVVTYSMVVVCSELDIYGSPNFSGAPVMVKQKGETLTVSTSDGSVYTVYSTSGIVGYCRASGLLYADTRTVVRLPAQFVKEVYREQTVVPSEDPERPGEYDIVYGEEITKIRVSELADLNEYAYRRLSPFAPSSEVILLQRDILEALERYGSSLSSAGLSFSVESGYSLTEPSEIAGLYELPLSVRSGALLKITCINSAGNKVSAAANVYSRNALSAAGLTRVGETDWYYSNNYDNYANVTVTSSDYVYVIYD